MSSDIQPVKLNMIDTVFFGKNNEDSICISQILCGAYGEDNDITALISKIKLPKEGKEPKEISVVRDVDGHLTWKVKDKEIKIGSSWWERVKHAVNSFFSFCTDYKVTHVKEVSDKVQRITDAFIACLDKEKAALDQQEAADKLAQQQGDLMLAIQARDQKLASVQLDIISFESKLTNLTLDYAGKGLERDALSPERDNSCSVLANVKTYEQDCKTFQDKEQMYSDQCRGAGNHEATIGKKNTTKRATFIKYLRTEPDRLVNRKLLLGDYDLVALQSAFDRLDQSYQALLSEISDLADEIEVKEQALSALKAQEADLLLKTDDVLKAEVGL